MDSTFLTAFIAPKDWDVCGYKLKPYSVRIHLNLLAVESPFATGKLPTAMETVEFLRYCSCGDKNILDADTFSIRDIIFYYKIALDPKKHADVIKKISIYMREFIKVPSFKVKSKNPNPHERNETLVENKTVPELMTMMCICMQKANLTEEQVLSMPIGKLAWYSASVAILEGGDVTVEDEMSKEDADAMRKAMDEHANAYAEKMRLAMVNGEIPKMKVRVE